MEYTVSLISARGTTQLSTVWHYLAFRILWWVGSSTPQSPIQAAMLEFSLSGNLALATKSLKYGFVNLGSAGGP